LRFVGFYLALAFRRPLLIPDSRLGYAYPDRDHFKLGSTQWIPTY